jgi:hypothetical protein
MADKNLLGQMLEHLVNDDSAKAEELFHEYVVAASREIYESLIDSEVSEEAEEDDEEAVEEATEEDDEEAVEESTEEDDEEMDEGFEDIAYEGGEEDEMGADPTDELSGEMDGEEGPEEEKSEEELFMDLDAIVDELQAKFDELKGHEAGEEEMGDEEGGNPFAKEEGFGEPALATVREYVEKVPAGHGAEKKGAAEKADNTKSTIDNMKNDMGGTTANILSSKEDAATYANQGQLKGNGLEKGKVGDNPDAKGNVNVPGGNAGKTGFKSKEPGHGAEKKGSAESADNKQSLFRGRR